MRPGLIVLSAGLMAKAIEAMLKVDCNGETQCTREAHADARFALAEYRKAMSGDGDRAG